MSRQWTITHASQRYDRDDALLSAAVSGYLSGGSLVTLTEVAGRLGAIRGPGRGVHAASDCAVLWDARSWRVRHETVVVYAGDWLHKSGATGRPLMTPVVVLEAPSGERAVVAAVHLPAGVETNYARGNLSRQRASRAHARQVRREVNRLARRFGAIPLIGADWNLNLKRPRVRAWMRATFPRWVGYQRRYLPRAGTHGGRLIDMALVRRARIVRVHVHPVHSSSDHRAISVTVRPKES